MVESALTPEDSGSGTPAADYLISARALSRKMVDRGRRQAEEILRDANTRADAIVARAQQQAEEILAAAKEEAERLVCGPGPRGPLRGGLLRTDAAAASGRH